MKTPSQQINRGPSPDFQVDEISSQTHNDETIRRIFSKVRPPRWMKLVHGVLTIGLGSCMLLGALFLFYRTTVFVNRATPTTGTVIEHKVTVSSSNSNRGGSTTTTSYHPVVQFQPPQGGSIQFVSKTGDNSPGDRRVGLEVPVLFNPNDPSDAEIHSFYDIWFGPIFLFVFGSIWTGVGVLSRIFLWKEN
jgi:uncharacterized protein DUF3592